MTELAFAAAAALDPVQLATQVGLQRHEDQEEGLRSRDRRLLLCCHRQWGKSTIVSVKALHRAIYRPGSTILVVAPTERQSQELMYKILKGYRLLGKPIRPDTENKLSLELENGSRIIGLPGDSDNIRAYAADLLIIDEASRVPDEMWFAVFPMVGATGGQIVALSTPNGRTGWFYAAAHSSTWKVITIRPADSGRVSDEDLQIARETFPDPRFRSEYLCEFTEATGQFFTEDEIDSLFRPGDWDTWGDIGDLLEDAGRQPPAPRTVFSPNDPWVQQPGRLSSQGEIDRHLAARRRRRDVRVDLASIRQGVRGTYHQHQWLPAVGDRRHCSGCPAEVPA